MFGGWDKLAQGERTQNELTADEFQKPKVLAACRAQLSLITYFSKALKQVRLHPYYFVENAKNASLRSKTNIRGIKTLQQSYLIRAYGT